MSDTEKEVQLNPINVQVPPFKYGDPEFWFARLENFFFVQRVTSQATKFGYASSILPDDIAEQVRDVLLHPPKENPYDELRREVIKRTSISEQKRIQQLLTGAELGDRTPSQLLRHMQQLVGQEKIDPSLFRQLWLQRLPTMVQQILASKDDKTEISRLAEIADRILACPLPSVNTVEQTPADSLLQQLSQQVQLLTGQVMALQTSKQFNQETRPSRTPRRPRRNSRSSSRPRDICKYHHRFGEKAYHCILPCKMSYLLSGKDRASE